MRILKKLFAAPLLKTAAKAAAKAVWAFPRAALFSAAIGMAVFSPAGYGAESGPKGGPVSNPVSGLAGHIAERGGSGPKGDPDRNGDTALHSAIKAAGRDRDGDTDARLRRVMRLLLRESGHLANALNHAGEAPLFLARTYPATARLLLQSGADPNIITPQGGTVFQSLLLGSFDPGLLKMIFRESQFQPDINIIDKSGGHSLLQIILQEILLAEQFFQSEYPKHGKYKGQPPVAYVFDLFQENSSWRNFLADIGRRAEQAAIIINNGANLSHRNFDGELALHLAVRQRSPQTARLIIQRGGTEYLTEEDRKALARLAAEQGHNKIIALLSAKPPFSGKPSFRDSAASSCRAALSRFF